MTWASAHPALAAWLCAAVFFLAAAGIVAVILRSLRDTGAYAADPLTAAVEAVMKDEAQDEAAWWRTEGEAPLPAALEAGAESDRAFPDWLTGEFKAVDAALVRNAMKQAGEPS